MTDGIISLAAAPKIEKLSIKVGDIYLTSFGRMICTEVRDDGTAVVVSAPEIIAPKGDLQSLREELRLCRMALTDVLQVDPTLAKTVWAKEYADVISRAAQQGFK